MALEKEVQDFQRERQNLMNVNMQKQQLQFQVNTFQNALNELKNSKDETVYKIVGNILVQKKTKDVEKELKKAKENIDLRIKTLQKQEDSIVKRLNKLKSSIEKAQEKGLKKKKDK